MEEPDDEGRDVFGELLRKFSGDFSASRFNSISFCFVDGSAWVTEVDVVVVEVEDDEEVDVEATVESS